MSRSTRARPPSTTPAPRGGASRKSASDSRRPWRNSTRRSRIPSRNCTRTGSTRWTSTRPASRGPWTRTPSSSWTSSRTGAHVGDAGRGRVRGRREPRGGSRAPPDARVHRRRVPGGRQGGDAGPDRQDRLRPLPGPLHGPQGPRLPDPHLLRGRPGEGQLHGAPYRGRNGAFHRGEGEGSQGGLPRRQVHRGEARRCGTNDPHRVAPGQGRRTLERPGPHQAFLARRGPPRMHALRLPPHRPRPRELPHPGPEPQPRPRPLPDQRLPHHQPAELRPAHVEVLPTEGAEPRAPGVPGVDAALRRPKVYNKNKKKYEADSGMTRAYQILQSSQLSAFEQNVVPEAKFTYDLSPIAVSYERKWRKWYDYLTSVMAIIGGTFTVVGMLESGIDTVTSKKRR